MPRPKPFLVAGVAILLALTVALAAGSAYRITIQPRPPEPLLSLAKPQATAASDSPAPLPLRLVDSGGVGIPLSADWGRDYSHDRRVFREVIREEAPYVDAAAFQRVDQDWHTYVERMRAYGNNAIAVPLFLELIDFDRVRPAGGATLANVAHDSRAATAASTTDPVYDASSPFRARHAAVRRHVGPMFDWAQQQGLQVFVDTDMLALTPPLARHLRRVAPAAGIVGIDASDPAVWAVYRAGLDELFDTLPSIAGVVIRFGEGGSLYNSDGWPYRSEMAVRDAKSLRAMLRALLPLFEARHKTLILRSWTVGIGQLGRLHIDPQVYEKVLGDIDSPALVVSTKFTAGDFFSYLPLNRTLATGRHRRIVELQAKPEFEGFGAFPNFLGDEHAQALRVLTAANPHIVGTYVLSQFGGPLRAGPRMLYPLHGFWLWTDANVFVASRLAHDPRADVHALARQWAAMRFGDDPRIVDAIENVLIQTRRAVLDGFYIRSFAERGVRVPGLELPPLMWIFEWDMVGGWHSLLSIVYRGTRDAVPRAIDEGDAAVVRVRRAREQVQVAFAAAAPGTCTQVCADTLRSLEYQETLFEALAAWRQSFLSYYRWLDTGDAQAWQRWRAGRQRFEAAAAQHVARFGHDLDFPAFDLRSATQAVTAADRGTWARRVAGVLFIGTIALLTIGSPLGRRSRALARTGTLARLGQLAWTTVVTPWRLSAERVDLGSVLALTTMALVLVAVLLGMLTGFATASMAAGSSLLVAVVAIAFEGTAIGVAWPQTRGRRLVASVGPLMSAIVILFAVIAWVGPLGFWYWFWIWPAFRVACLTLLLTTIVWTVYVMMSAHTRETWHARIGGSLTAAGAGLITLTALLPDWVHVLRFLDRPLNFAPATDTMLFALRTYAGVSLGMSRFSWTLGGLLLACGYALWLRSVLRAPGK